MSQLAPTPIVFDYQLCDLSEDESQSLKIIESRIEERMLVTSLARQIRVPRAKDILYIAGDYHNFSHACTVTELALAHFDAFFTSTGLASWPQINYQRERRNIRLALKGHDVKHYGWRFKEYEKIHPDIRFRQLYSLLDSHELKSISYFQEDYHYRPSERDEMGGIEITAEEYSAVWLIQQMKEENKRLLSLGKQPIYSEDDFKDVFDIIFSTIVHFEESSKTVNAWALRKIMTGNQVVSPDLNLMLKIETFTPWLPRIARTIVGSRADIDQWVIDHKSFVYSSILLGLERFSREHNIKKLLLQHFPILDSREQQKVTEAFMIYFSDFFEGQERYVRGRKEYLEQERRWFAFLPSYNNYFSNLEEQEELTIEEQRRFRREFFRPDNTHLYDLLDTMHSYGFIQSHSQPQK